MLSINEEYHQQDRNRRRNAVQKFCYACAIANLFSFAPDLYYQIWTTVLGGVLISLFFLLMNLINVKYSTNLAANLLLGVGNVIAFVFANLLGKAANVQYVLFISILFIPFMLDVYDKRFVFFHTTFPFVLLLLLEATDYTVFPQLITFTPAQLKVFAVVNVLTMLLISPLIISSIINTHTDIYKLLIKSGEKMEIQNAELAKTNAELDKFVYSVSHDLRSPIASALGLVYLSKQENNLEVLREYELLKEKSLKKLDGFIRDILDYSRNTRIEINPQPIDWQLFSRQAIEQHQHSPEARGMVLTTAVNQQGKFYTDHHRIGIVFNNLISNAICYHDSYKPSSFLRITIISKPEKTTLLFEDNGIGIAEEHHEKVFKMFYRATENSKGSGLGLYIVAETIQKLKGKITLQSEVGKKTTFMIELPHLVG